MHFDTWITANRSQRPASDLISLGLATCQRFQLPFIRSTCPFVQE